MERVAISGLAAQSAEKCPKPWMTNHLVRAVEQICHFCASTPVERGDRQYHHQTVDRFQIEIQQKYIFPGEVTHSEVSFYSAWLEFLKI